MYREDDEQSISGLNGIVNIYLDKAFAEEEFNTLIATIRYIGHLL